MDTAATARRRSGIGRQRTTFKMSLPQRSLLELTEQLDAQAATWDRSGRRFWLKITDDGRVRARCAALGGFDSPPILRGRLTDPPGKRLRLEGQVVESRAAVASVWLFGFIAALALGLFALMLTLGGPGWGFVVFFGLSALAFLGITAMLQTGRRLSFPADVDDLRREVDRRLRHAVVDPSLLQPPG